MKLQDKHGYVVSWFRAEFVDPQMEQDFRKHVEEATARHLAMAVCAWAVLLLLFAPLDLLDLGPGIPLYVLLGMRVLQATLLFCFGWWVLKRPSLATNGWPVTILEIVGFPLYFLIFVYRPEIYATNLGVILILLLSMYLFIPNRVVLTNLTAAVGVVGTLATLMWQGMAAEELVGLVPVLLLPPIIGYVAARRIQVMQRSEFVLLREGQKRNEVLQDEVRRREELEFELQRQATTDPLTGLYNRRQYETLFNRERERSQRQGGSLIVGIMDLDSFKQINDTYGHHVGDLVLCHVAQVLQEPLRQTDVLGRFGGEEFILILPDTSLELAVSVVERLRRALQDSPMVIGGGVVQVTGTFAVTEVRPEDRNIASIIRRADEALYEGKAAGRNRVVVARPTALQS